MGYVALDKDEVKVIQAVRRIREAGGTDCVSEAEMQSVKDLACEVAGADSQELRDAAEYAAGNER